MTRIEYRFPIPITITFIVLIAVYLLTLQTMVSAADHYFMLDSGETQIVLNVWGTLHATGYPLYVMIGSALTALLRLFGVSPEAAPAFASTLWMLGALLGMAAFIPIALRGGTRHIPNAGLMARVFLKNRRFTPIITAVVVLIYGLTRTVWVHAVIPEIYAMTLAFLVGLYGLAVIPLSPERRLYLLAFVGGIAIAHHRAFIVIIPALLYAVAPDLIALVRRRWWTLLIALALGTLGFLPYLYLPARAIANAPWVYGDPGTLTGFLDQFLGREAGQFIGFPSTWEALDANFDRVMDVLSSDWSGVGLVVGWVGMGAAVGFAHTRRIGLMLLLGGLGALLFHGFFYTDILSALILIITFTLACGCAFTLYFAAYLLQSLRPQPLLTAAEIALIGVAGAFYFVQENGAFIDTLTHDPVAAETVAIAARAEGSILMIPWGGRHTAVGFARDVSGAISQNITLIDHNADLASPARSDALVTLDSTFYVQPITWWEERIGAPIYLSAVAPSLVRVTPEMGYIADATPIIRGKDANTPALYDAYLVCDAPGANALIALHVDWGRPERAEMLSPASIFVHGMNTDRVVIALGDQSAPVYGWRPFETFAPGERVHDVYTLPRLPKIAQIAFGTYIQTPDGAFQNTLEMTLPVVCE